MNKDKTHSTIKNIFWNAVNRVKNIKVTRLHFIFSGFLMIVIIDFLTKKKIEHFEDKKIPADGFFIRILKNLHNIPEDLQKVIDSTYVDMPCDNRSTSKHIIKDLAKIIGKEYLPLLKAIHKQEYMQYIGKSNNLNQSLLGNISTIESTPTHDDSLLHHSICKELSITKITNDSYYILDVMFVFDSIGKFDLSNRIKEKYKMESYDVKSSYDLVNNLFKNHPTLWREIFDVPTILKNTYLSEKN